MFWWFCKYEIIGVEMLKAFWHGSPNELTDKQKFFKWEKQTYGQTSKIRIRRVSKLLKIIVLLKVSFFYIVCVILRKKSFNHLNVFGVSWNFYSFQLNFYLDFKITKVIEKDFFFYYLLSCQFFFYISQAVLFLLGFNLSFHNTPKV
jgi:hypothetical protein